MTEMSGKSIIARGWIMRDNIPTEIEYEYGFAAMDGFPFCREVSSQIPLSVTPASSREELIDVYVRAIGETIAQYQQAIITLEAKREALLSSQEN